MVPVTCSIAVAILLVGQVASADTDEAQEREILIAIQQLGSTDYATREQASQNLWRHGLAAEAALRRASKSRDAETRLRARRLLRDFEYGILPDVSRDIRQVIRQFRDGDATAHQEALRWLTEKQHFQVVERLVRFEPDPQTRKSLLLFLFESPAIIDQYLAPGRIQSLVDAVGFDQDEQWKRSVYIQLTFAPKVLSRLAATDRLSHLLQPIQAENDAQYRQLMFAAIVRSPAIGAILAGNNFEFLFDVLRCEPDLQNRGKLLTDVFANAQAAQAIVKFDQLEPFFRFSAEQTDMNSQRRLLREVLASGPIVDSLLKTGGIDRVVAIATKETDPIERGKLLGATISSSTVRTFLQRNGQSQLAIRLAKEEQNEAARHEFLQSLLHDTSFVYSLSDESTIAELWQLIKADQHASWRAQSLVVLLQTRRAHALLRDKEEAAWILKLASEDGAGPAREDILRFLLPDVQAQHVLIADGHFEAMLSLARQLPLRSRGEILGNFLAGSGVAQHLLSTNRIETLIAVTKEEADSVVRQQCLRGVFRNSTAMAALLKAGHYTTFRAMIQQDDDAIRRASLLSDFFQSAHVIAELANQGGCRALLDVEELKHDGAREQYLSGLFQNHSAITKLIEEGHFLRVLKLAQQDGGPHFANFLGVPRVIEQLVASKQFALFVDFATVKADDDTRRTLLRNILSSTQTIDSLIASDNFAPVLRLVQAERDPTWRGSLLGPVLGSSAVASHYAEAKKLDELLSLISNDSAPVVRARLLSYLTRRSDVVATYVQNGYFDALIACVMQESKGQIQASTLVNIVTNKASLKLLEADRRVGVLLSFVKESDDEFVLAYLSRLLAQTDAIDLLVEQGYFGDLFHLATTGPKAEWRTVLLGRLLSNPKAIEQIIVRHEVNKLVAMAGGEGDAKLRRTYLTAICRSDAVMDELMKQGLFDSLLSTLQGESDPAVKSRLLGTLLYSGEAVAKLADSKLLEPIFEGAMTDSDVDVRASWLSTLFGRPDSFEAIVKLGHGEPLLDAAAKELPIATQQSLFDTACNNRKGIQALLGTGQFEKLRAMSERLGSRHIGVFYRSSAVIEYCVSNKRMSPLLEAVEKLSGNESFGVLYSLAQNGDARKALLEGGKFETLCEVIQDRQAPSQQASLFNVVFSSPDVVRHYVDTNTLSKLLAYLTTTATPVAREQILSVVFARRDLIGLVIEHGGFDTMLRLTKEHTHGETQSRLLGQLLTTPAALAKLVENESVDSLLSYATDSDNTLSAPFVSSLFSSQEAVRLLINHGHFAALYKLVTTSKDARTRTESLGQLLRASEAIEHLKSSNELPVVVNYARDEKDIGVRRTYLGQLCSNQALIKELVRAELFNELVTVVESDSDLDQRRRLFASLLYSDIAIEAFATDGRLELIVADLLVEPDAARRTSWLSNVMGSPSVLPMLMKHGQGDALLEAARTQLDSGRLHNAYRMMLSNSATLSVLAREGRHQLAFDLLDSETLADQRSYLLSQIVRNDEMVRAVIKADQLNDLLERAAKLDDRSSRESTQHQILASRATIAAFSEAGKLTELFELVRRLGNEQLTRRWLQDLIYSSNHRRQLTTTPDPTSLVSILATQDPQFSSGLVMRLLASTQLRRCWIEGGNLAALEKLIALLPDDATRVQQTQNLYYTPSGVLGYQLRNQQFDQAEGLLKKYRGDLAMSWIVDYWLSRGQLDTEIERLGALPLDSQTDYDRRLLAYSHRARGDLKQATIVARQLDDKRLLRPLLVEQRQWSEAAKLQSDSTLLPPVEFAGYVPDAKVAHLEQLGMLASYHRLAHDEQACDEVVAEILALVDANKSDLRFCWYAAQMLLLNDRVAEGLRATEQADPVKAFELLGHRYEYEASLALVNCNLGFTADRKWYDMIPLGAQQGNQYLRIQFATEIALRLSKAGRADDANCVLSLLETIVQEAPERGNTFTRQSLGHRLATAMYRIGERARAWQVFATIHSPSTLQSSSAMTTLFGTRGNEAHTWWLVLNARERSLSPKQRFERIHAVMNPGTQAELDAFPALFEQAVEIGGTTKSDYFWRGLADTCVANRRSDLAVECYQQLTDFSPTVRSDYARLLFSLEQWLDAADAYYAAWEEESDTLGWLYLAGVARERAGEIERGRELQNLADLQAVTPKIRYRLASVLSEHGAGGAAIKQWERLSRIAPFESLERNDASRRMAIHLQSENPERAAELWEHYLLGDVRPAFWLLNDAEHLISRARIHRLRAVDAISRSDFATAKDLTLRALRLVPGDMSLVEEMVQLFDAEGQRDISDELVAQIVDYFAARCASSPESATLHNNLAWAAARNGRLLDRALAHAQRAVELEPEAAGFLDTLAEVYFQRGDREEAIRYAERALALRPLGTSLMDQLDRFRSAPLPKP